MIPERSSTALHEKLLIAYMAVKCKPISTASTNSVRGLGKNISLKSPLFQEFQELQNPSVANITLFFPTF
jgi:hypothetical protein